MSNQRPEPVRTRARESVLASPEAALRARAATAVMTLGTCSAGEPSGSSSATQARPAELVSAIVLSGSSTTG
jgi:hypothetical protein